MLRRNHEEVNGFRDELPTIAFPIFVGLLPALDATDPLAVSQETRSIGGVA